MDASTSLRTDLDIDLEAVVRCEVRREAEASWHVFGTCPGCGTSRHALVCQGCRTLLTGAKPTRCSNCNFSGPGKKFFRQTLQL